MAVTSLSASWDAAPNAVAYEAEWRKDSGNWVRVPRTSALGFDVPGIYAGRYLVRVRALNVMEVGSVYASSVETALEGKTTPPPALAYLRCVAGPWRIGLEWGFRPAARRTPLTPRSSSPPRPAAARRPHGRWACSPTQAIPTWYRRYRPANGWRSAVA